MKACEHCRGVFSTAQTMPLDAPLAETLGSRAGEAKLFVVCAVGNGGKLAFEMANAWIGCPTAP